VLHSSEPDTPSALERSPLWRKAYERMKDDPEREKYTELVNKNADLAGNNVNSPAGIRAIAEKVSNQVEKQENHKACSAE
jgi:hypothetical protein